MSDLAVAMTGISKRFGSVVALDDVSLKVPRNTIHAIVGENGAGKTTLMKALYGAHPPDTGTIELDGRTMRLRNSAEAIREGIGMVSQHYAVIPDLTCLENLMLGAEPSAIIDRSASKYRADELAESMGFAFAWDAPARGIGPAGRQKLEILKLLWRNSRIMILDEPTAMLSPEDANALYASLKELTAGGATVIVVTHRLPEVLDHCKDVTVLRGGKLIDALPVSECDTNRLATLIIGHEAPPVSLRPAQTSPQPLLQVSGLRVKDERGFEILRGVDLDVNRGEVLGLAGVDGNGQRELFAALIGRKRAESGRITLGGEYLHNLSADRRLKAGIRLIPEDRHHEGVVEDWSLLDNAPLGMQGSPPFARGSWIDDEGKSAATEAIADKFSTKRGSLGAPISSLSGGNQQRFVNGRAVVLSPRVILAFQPARGLDVDATRRFYEALYEEGEKGAGALVVSFDLDELLTFCDRIVVLNVGKVFEPSASEAKDRSAIGRLMVATR